ncbi:MAG: hypothetical protein J2P24_00735, partial [Streptosporangiales bacterium]|nr:hypothetical protein [Streptosporangiales bacterium]
MNGLGRIARCYIGSIAVVGGALFVFGATHVISWAILIPVVVLIIAADAAPAILVRSDRGQGAAITVSAGFPIRMAAVVLIGPWGAVLSTVVTLFAFVPGGRPLVKRVFNVGQLVITVCVSGLVYTTLGGHIGPLSGHDVPSSVFPFAVAAFVYYLTNTALVTGIVMLTSDMRLRAALPGFIAPFAATYLGYGTVGLLLPILWSEVGILAAVLALGPIFVARWAASQLVAEREAREGTLRAFARAVETKDYYTRGHSDRVARLSELMGREAK